MEGNRKDSATKQENNRSIVVGYHNVYVVIRLITMLIEYSDDNEECRTVVG